jgi:hypothetical protein
MNPTIMKDFQKMNLLNPMRAFEFKKIDLERMQMHKILTEKRLLEAFDNRTKHKKEEESILDPLESKKKFYQEQFKVFEELIK